MANRPRVWSGKSSVTFPSTRSYDPAADGKRIVALMAAETAQEQHDRVIFLLNFYDELRRCLPSGAN